MLSLPSCTALARQWSAPVDRVQQNRDAGCAARGWVHAASRRRPRSRHDDPSRARLLAATPANQGEANADVETEPGDMTSFRITWTTNRSQAALPGLTEN
jgi:hypothetical protein